MKLGMLVVFVALSCTSAFALDVKVGNAAVEDGSAAALAEIQQVVTEATATAAATNTGSATPRASSSANAKALPPPPAVQENGNAKEPYQEELINSVLYKKR